MATIESKKDMILEHERLFAHTLGLRVLNKPKLSIWMILIPIIFVYYFYQYQRFTESRKQFSENYLKSRERALNEAFKSVIDKKEPDIDSIAAPSDVPEAVIPFHAKVLSILVDHYRGLFQAKGNDFSSLVRSLYGSQTNYLLFLNSLNNAEKKMNDAIKPVLKESLEGVDEVIRKMEEESEKIRREFAESFFQTGA